MGIFTVILLVSTILNIYYNIGKPVSEAEKYEFEFRNVSFKYPKSENYALKNL